jgi:hypothetical protein
LKERFRGETEFPIYLIAGAKDTAKRDNKYMLTEGRINSFGAQKQSKYGGP